MLEYSLQRGDRALEFYLRDLGTCVYGKELESLHKFLFGAHVCHYHNHIKFENTHLFSFLLILEGLKHFKLSGSKGPPYPTPVDCEGTFSSASGLVTNSSFSWILPVSVFEECGRCTGYYTLC